MARKMIGLVVIWSLALVWGGAAVAQEAGTLVGVVLDSDGQPLPGATVSVSGPELTKNAGSLADTSGAFLIQPLPSGLYDVEISHLGYRNVVQSVRIRAGETRDLNFVLEVALIYLEQSVVTASRRQEKALDAPASVAVVEGEEIQDRSVLNVSEHVRDLPGVDYAKNGLVQSNVVVRGFNNIFSGALLTLTDNRLAHVPSLRLNANNFIPVVNDDIERIEVVLGPGSALYGPNSASGVMHIITRSPLRSQGTSVQIGLGERSLRKSSLRHAGTITPHLGYKISAQYYTGTDWKYDDPTEAAARAATPTLKARDFDIKRQSAELRFDYEPSSDLQFIVSGGLNKADYIELTGLGAGQGKDWASNYAQARLIYGNLFAQVFRNWSDAGDTFLLGSGTPIVDRSSINVFQIQHRASLKDRLKLTYGLDALLTRPDTDGTITGQNEDYDDINEIGAYVQGEADLTDMLDLVLAVRIDDHNRVEKSVLSPRAAVVAKLDENQSLRLTYNRAFSTPTTNNLYLDLSSRADVFGTGASFAPSLGFSPAYDLRAQGTYREGFAGGFTFRHDQTGEAMYRTPFAPVIQQQLAALGISPGGPGYSINADGYIAMNDPIATGVMWGIGRGAVLAQFLPGLEPILPGIITQALVAQGVPAETAASQASAQAAAVLEKLPSLVPTQLAGLSNTTHRFNLQTLSFDQEVAQARNVSLTEPTITQTIEVGYKGIIGGKLVMAADVYRTETDNFVGPLGVETPNVFLDSAPLAVSLGTAFATALADPDNADVALVVAALDGGLPGVVEGNGNGSGVDELATIFASGAARIPFGTVSPEQAHDPTAILLGYRNFGDVTLYGLDLSLGYFPNDIWSVKGSYSFVNDDFFEKLGGIADVNLNAPKHKVKVAGTYRVPNYHLSLGGRVRYNGSFPMNSGVYVGAVDAYTVVDASLSYDLPWEGLSLLVNVDNVLDSAYRSFIGAPEIGRLAYVQLGARF